MPAPGRSGTPRSRAVSASISRRDYSGLGRGRRRGFPSPTLGYGRGQMSGLPVSPPGLPSSCRCHSAVSDSRWRRASNNAGSCPRRSHGPGIPPPSPQGRLPFCERPAQGEDIRQVAGSPTGSKAFAICRRIVSSSTGGSCLLFRHGGGGVGRGGTAGVPIRRLRSIIPGWGLRGSSRRDRAAESLPQTGQGCSLLEPSGQDAAPGH